jgi:hypothetical protein
METPSPSQRIHFNSFELDLESGELLKNRRGILYTQYDQLGSDLMLVENPF